MITSREGGKVGVMQSNTCREESILPQPLLPTYRRAPGEGETVDLQSSDWRPGLSSKRQPPGRRLSAFISAQQAQLLELRDALLGSMNGSVREARLEKADSSAFATHNVDAASDASDRDLVLCLLSQETDALSEIDQALERIASGTYGICEISGRPIPISRLRAIPFARYTVEFQEKIERQRKLSSYGRKANVREILTEEMVTDL